MIPRLALTASALSLAALVACSPESASTSGATSSTASASGGSGGGGGSSTDPDPIILARPYDIYVPPTYSADKPAPLVLAFHGYGDGDTGPILETYFHLKPVADQEGFLYITPNGTKDKTGQQFWNGTDACCDFFKSGTDDVAYVRAIIDDVAKHYNLDPKRVYVTGLSGGALFAHRLACDLSDRVAAVFSVSGATYADATRCQPTDGVAIVEFHGDKDGTINYLGGTMSYGQVQDVAYPSAHDTVARWAQYDGCPGALADTGTTYDFETTVAGAETHVAAYSGCAKGDVELWTAVGGPHFTYLTPTFGATVWSYFAAHPKP